MSKGINKSPRGFNKKAFDDFFNKKKPPIDIQEQKIEGHIFINILIKQNTIIQTSLRYGLSSLIDSGLVNHAKNINIKWFGKEKLDTLQSIVIGIKVDYRFCKLQNVSKTNLTQFSKSTSSNKNFKNFINSYNIYESVYKFDTVHLSNYNKKVAKNKKIKIEASLQNISWIKDKTIKKQVIIDYDKNKIPNVIIQTNDSVFILENNAITFSEKGILKTIKYNKKISFIELETVCNECSKYAKTSYIYKTKNQQTDLEYIINTYSSSPQLPDTISTIDTLTIISEKAYLRSSPYKINEPYNKCTGIVSEEYTCYLPKTWGNIFGEIEQNTSVIVLQSYIDSFKKKWYFVIAYRTDGVYLGWIQETDTNKSFEN